MKKYYKLGKIFGIEIGLHYSWFFIFFFLSYVLSKDYFPQYFPELTTLQFWIVGTLSALFLFASVLLHELCHSLVAKANNIPIRRIQLFFFGGVAELQEEPTNPLVELFMALAGPFFSIALGLFCFAIYPLITALPVQAILHYLARINLILGIFNLLPGFPLDGGRAFRAFLWLITKNYEKATFYATRSGKFIGGMLMLLGFLSIFSGSFGGIWFVLIGGFLYFMAEMSFEQVIIKKKLIHVKVREVYEKNFDVLKPNKTVTECLADLLHSPQDLFPVTDKNKNLLGAVSINRLQQIPPQIRNKITIKQVMIPAKKIPKVTLSSDLYPILIDMAKNGASLLPVTKGKKVIGIISKEAVLHYLRVKMSFKV